MRIGQKKQREGEEMTWAEHAERWWKEQGKTVPPKDTKEWDSMFFLWYKYAVSNSGEWE